METEAQLRKCIEEKLVIRDDVKGQLYYFDATVKGILIRGKAR